MCVFLIRPIKNVHLCSENGETPTLVVGFLMGEVAFRIKILEIVDVVVVVVFTTTTTAPGNR